MLESLNDDLMEGECSSLIKACTAAFKEEKLYDIQFHQSTAYMYTSSSVFIGQKMSHQVDDNFRHSPYNYRHNKKTKTAVGYLAVSGWNGLRLVSAHVVIDTLLELFGNQSTIFPAAL